MSIHVRKYGQSERSEQHETTRTRSICAHKFTQNYTTEAHGQRKPPSRRNFFNSFNFRFASLRILGLCGPLAFVVLRLVTLYYYHSAPRQPRTAVYNKYPACVYYPVGARVYGYDFLSRHQNRKGSC